MLRVYKGRSPLFHKIINKLINAATKAGAGRFGNYTRCAIVTKSFGTWKSEKGAHPSIGKVGMVSRVKSVKIDMSCSKGKLKAVCKALREAHPYEEPDIYFVKVEKYA